MIRNLQSQWTQPYSYVPDPIEMLRRTIVERRERIERWQSRVTWSCIVLATLVACYFAAELGRGVL